MGEDKITDWSERHSYQDQSSYQSPDHIARDGKLIRWPDSSVSEHEETEYSNKKYINGIQ